MDLDSYVDDRLPFPVNFAQTFIDFVNKKEGEEETDIDKLIRKTDAITIGMLNTFVETEVYQAREAFYEDEKSCRRAGSHSHRVPITREGPDPDDFFAAMKHPHSPSIRSKVNSQGLKGRLMKFRQKNMRNRVKMRCIVKMKDNGIYGLIGDESPTALNARMMALEILPEKFNEFPEHLHTIVRQLRFVLNENKTKDISKIGHKGMPLREYIRLVHNYHQLVKIHFARSKWVFEACGESLSGEAIEFMAYWNMASANIKQMAETVGLNVPKFDGEFRPIFPSGLYAPKGYGLPEMCEQKETDCTVETTSGPTYL